MKKLRNMKWEDYGISRALHAELKAFCLQYEEKKSKLQYGLQGIQYTGMPHGSSTESGVESAAIHNTILFKDCEMIEQAAIATDAILAPYLIKSVAYDLPYEYVVYDETYGKIPVGKTDFYAYRRKFFFELWELKLKREMGEK